MKKRAAIFLAACLFAQFAAGCGEDPPDAKSESAKPGFDLAGAKDGTYTAESSSDDTFGKGKLSLTIENQKITEATYFGIDKEGNIKDADYGKIDGDTTSANYKKAQTAVKANATYAAQLIAAQDLGKVDAVSGATVSYEQFSEAVLAALDQAKHAQ